MAGTGATEATVETTAKSAECAQQSRERERAVTRQAPLDRARLRLRQLVAGDRGVEFVDDRTADGALELIGAYVQALRDVTEERLASVDGSLLRCGKRAARERGNGQHRDSDNHLAPHRIPPG
jgi:hypothetical protein